MSISPKYPLTYSTWTEEEISVACNIIKSKNTTMSDNVAEFEQKFSQYLDVSYSLMVNSGSSANLLMAAVLREYLSINDDSRNTIIIPAVGWSTSYSPFIQLGFNIVICDVDQFTFNISTGQLAALITDDTCAILAINILGNASDFDNLRIICDNACILLMEDNCESLGAKYSDQYCGSFGSMSSHSFFYSHHINTMEGGMFSTSNADLFLLALCIRNHGWVRDLQNFNTVLNRSTPVAKYLSSLVEASNLSYDNKFFFILPGYNLRPTEVQGALGLLQLTKLSTFINHRKENFEYFVYKLSLASYPLYIQSHHAESSHFGIGLIFESEDLRNTVSICLSNAGIQSRPIVCGNIMRSPLSKYFYSNQGCNLENADIIHNQGLYIGNSHICLKGSIDYFFEVLDNFLDNHVN